MKRYTKVLVAIELLAKNDKIILKKALEVAEQFQSHLTLFHAVEYLGSYGTPYGISSGVEIEETLVEQAKHSLERLGVPLDIAQQDQVVEVGPAAHMILDQAKIRETDLIILGSHGKHGVRLLLGSTANSVIHGAKCDVLAVRVHDH